MKNIIYTSVCLLSVASLMRGEAPDTPPLNPQSAHDAPLTYREVDRNSLGIVVPNTIDRLEFIDRTPEGALGLGSINLTHHDVAKYEHYKNNPEKFQDEFQRAQAPQYYAVQTVLKLSDQLKQQVTQLQSQRPSRLKIFKYYAWNSELREKEKTLVQVRKAYEKEKKWLDSEFKAAQDKFHALQKVFDNTDTMPWKSFAQRLPQQADLWKSRLQQHEQTKNYEQRVVLISPLHVDAFHFMRSEKVAEQETWDGASPAMDELIKKFKNHKRDDSQDQSYHNVIMVRSDISDQELKSAMASAEQDPEVQKLLQACGKLLLKNVRYRYEAMLKEQDAAMIGVSALAGMMMILHRI